MGLSRRHLDTNACPSTFDVDQLAAALERAAPGADLVYLLGSAAGGTVAAHSDIDISVLLGDDPHGNDEASQFSTVYRAIDEVVAEYVGPVRLDLGLLNRAEPVFRFESLRGRLLVCRDAERWLSFYERTCREYEERMVSYERQRRYRLAARRGEVVA